MSRLGACLMVVSATVGLAVLARSVLAADAGGEKAILITGASSGFGRTTTEMLASQGYVVYPGARKAEDIAALNAIQNVKALHLDVTVQTDIDVAVAQVEALTSPAPRQRSLVVSSPRDADVTIRSQVTKLAQLSK